MTSLEGLREYKYYLIGQMKEYPKDKRRLNRETRLIDKEIKRLLEARGS